MTELITPLVSVQHLRKYFGSTMAVGDVSFSVEAGEVFGLLGPNGAGKTTTIRMILDIFKQDAGTIEVFGGPLSNQKRDRIGYMPEERGLYPHMKVIDCLIYLGMLKGMTRKAARQSAESYLERLELSDSYRTKIEALSRGMTQKVQVIAAVIHQPDLLIIDEPFANLDPVNAQMVRNIFLDLRNQGGAIIVTSHRLPMVETLCDRIALIHQGTVVLKGTVAEVRRQFARNVLHLSGSGDLGQPTNVASIDRRTATEWYLFLEPNTNPKQVLEEIVANHDFIIDRFEVAMPTLDEIFVEVVKAKNL